MNENFNLYLNVVDKQHFCLRITFIFIPFGEPLFCLKVLAFLIFDLSLLFSNSYSVIAGDTVIVPGPPEEPALRREGKEQLSSEFLPKYCNCRGSEFFLDTNMHVRKLKTKVCRPNVAYLAVQTWAKRSALAVQQQLTQRACSDYPW